MANPLRELVDNLVENLGPLFRSDEEEKQFAKKYGGPVVPGYAYFIAIPGSFFVVFFFIVGIASITQSVENKVFAWIVALFAVSALYLIVKLLIAWGEERGIAIARKIEIEQARCG